MKGSFLRGFSIDRIAWSWEGSCAGDKQTGGEFFDLIMKHQRIATELSSGVVGGKIVKARWLKPANPTQERQQVGTPQAAEQPSFVPKKKGDKQRSGGGNTGGGIIIKLNKNKNEKY